MMRLIVEVGVTTPNIKNSALRPIAQTYCQRKSNGNRLLQLRLQSFRPLPSTVRKRSFMQLEPPVRLGAGNYFTGKDVEVEQD